MGAAPFGLCLFKGCGFRVNLMPGDLAAFLFHPQRFLEKHFRGNLKSLTEFFNVALVEFPFAA
jgi:hypothetical protein